MRKYKQKYKIKNIIILSIVITILIIVLITRYSDHDVYMVGLSNYSVNQIKELADVNELKLEIKYEYSNIVEKDKVISQSIKKDTLLKQNDKLTVVISLGKIPMSLYKENKVNELGLIPVMMYHGIHHLKNDDTAYTGGNVDSNGYNRTTEAFIDDLEMYYQKGYRMIRLQDYIDGNIDIPLGMSPIVLTFDDGNKNNIKVLGKDEKGELIIDPNSAVGILEQFKKKYPDYNVTATFFLNKNLFGQGEYNQEILEWLIEHGYDIGNHTLNHLKIADLSADNTIKEVALIYKLLDTIIPNKYVNIVALPLGSPTQKTHSNFQYILNGTYNNYTYTTECTLRVGWEADYSPYDSYFDKTYIKRIRAWDNNGMEDIEMHFKRLEKTRYISSGNKDIIVIPKDKESRLSKQISKQVVTY